MRIEHYFATVLLAKKRKETNRQCYYTVQRYKSEALDVASVDVKIAAGFLGWRAGIA